MERFKGSAAIPMLTAWMVGSGSASAQAQVSSDEAPETRGAPDTGAQPKVKPGASDAEPAIEPPELIEFVEAVYPPQAVTSGAAAVVTLRLDIDAEGNVSDAVVHESGGADFDAAAVAAARQFRFTPAKRNGQVVPSRILYRYTFKIDVEAVGSSYSGTLVHAETGQPIVGATLRLTLGQSIRTQTSDDQGHWSFGDLEKGALTLQLEAPGYVPQIVEDELGAAETREVVVSVTPIPIAPTTPDANQPVEVQVLGIRRAQPSVVRSIQAEEMRRVPGTFGDALRAIKSFPGVAQTPSLSGLLIVRGTGPESTQVFFDGVLTPQVYHFGGLSSVVPTEMLESIDFLPGNFGAKYGRGIGGIVDAKLRRSTKDGEYHGLAQVDFIDARLVAEGPIPGGDDWHFMGGVRRSHLDAWLGPLLEGTNTSFSQLPVYVDYQLFLDRELPNGDYVRVGVMGADDSLDLLTDTSVFLSRFQRHNAFWNVLSEYTTQLDADTSWEHVTSFGRLIERQEIGPIKTDSDVIPIVFRGELAHRFSDVFTLRTGPDIAYAPFAVTFRVPEENLTGNALATSPVLRPPRTATTHDAFFQPAVYSELDITAGERATLTPGLRLDYAYATRRWDLSPRLTARYAVAKDFPKTTLKAAAGAYYEPPEVRYTLDAYGQPDLISQKSLQFSAGFEQDLTRQLETTAQAFYSRLDDLTSQGVDADGLTQFNNGGDGRVYGAELMLRYKADDRFFGWLSYTLSRSERRPESQGPYELFDFDQTHIGSILGSYQLGAGWEVGARFRLVSGAPETPCGQSILSTSESAELCLPAGDRTERAPWFHQLDARVEKRWNLGRRFRLSSYLNVINVYNRQQADLPLVPSLGIRGEL